MAINLGQLKQYQAARGLDFEWEGKQYAVYPTVEQGLAFQVAANDRQDRMEKYRDTITSEESTPDQVDKAEMALRDDLTFGIYMLVAPIFGSRFHPPTQRKGASFEGGIIAELMRNGIEFGTLDRIISAMWLIMRGEDDEVVEEFFKTGKLQTARDNVENREALAMKETLKAPGETSGIALDEA